MSERYWQILLEGREAPDLEAAINARFRAAATPILCRRLRIPTGSDARPLTSAVDPDLFTRKLPALAGVLLLTYLESILEVFGSRLDLGATPEGADEWQVGSLNVYPEHGPYLAVLAEDLHDALAPFGPTSGRLFDELGTIAGRVYIALTDDLGRTLGSKAYRLGVFDPHRFSKLMTTRFVNSQSFDTLTSVASVLNKMVARAEGKDIPLPFPGAPPKDPAERTFAPITLPGLVDTQEHDAPEPDRNEAVASTGTDETAPAEPEPPREAGPVPEAQEQEEPAKQQSTGSSGHLSSFLGRLYSEVEPLPEDQGDG